MSDNQFISDVLNLTHISCHTVELHYLEPMEPPSQSWHPPAAPTESQHPLIFQLHMPVGISGTH